MVRTGRRSVYVPRDPENGLNRLFTMKGDESPSETIDTAVERYLTVIGHSMPRLTHAEWCLVFDALLAVWSADELSIQLIGKTVVEGMRDYELDQKWGVDGNHMIDVMCNLSYAEQQAICEMTELFRKDRGGGDYAVVIDRLLGHFEPLAQRNDYQPTRMTPDRLNVQP